MSHLIDIETAIVNFWEASAALSGYAVFSHLASEHTSFNYCVINGISNVTSDKTRTTANTGTRYSKASVGFKAYHKTEYGAGQFAKLIQSTLNDAEILDTSTGTILQFSINEDGSPTEESPGLWFWRFTADVLSSDARLR